GQSVSFAVELGRAREHLQQRLLGRVLGLRPREASTGEPAEERAKDDEHRVEGFAIAIGEATHLLGETAARSLIHPGVRQPRGRTSRNQGGSSRSRPSPPAPPPRPREAAPGAPPRGPTGREKSSSSRSPSFGRLLPAMRDR